MFRMVTFTEREALRQMIEYIKDERSRLWDEYVKITTRLSELDEIDNVHPPKEEVKQEPMSLLEAINVHNQVYGSPDEDTDLEEIVEEPQIKQRNSEIQTYKDYDNSKRVTKNNMKNSRYRDVQAISKDAVVILKEAGRPMRTKELIATLKGAGVSVHSPYALIQQIREYEPRIERVKFGYYQYR